MCIEWLRKRLCQPKIDIDPPTIKDDIDINEINTILQAEFGTDCKIYLSDINYNTTSKEELERFLAEDKTNYYQYVREYYDCDDFSYTLHGNLSIPGWSDLSFGIFWSDTPEGGHAINCFIDINREVWIIEPQNDSVFKLPDDWEPWLTVM